MAGILRAATDRLEVESVGITPRFWQQACTRDYRSRGFGHKPLGSEEPNQATGLPGRNEGSTSPGGFRGTTGKPPAYRRTGTPVGRGRSRLLRRHGTLRGTGAGGRLEQVVLVIENRVHQAGGLEGMLLDVPIAGRIRILPVVQSIEVRPCASHVGERLHESGTVFGLHSGARIPVTRGTWQTRARRLNPKNSPQGKVEDTERIRDSERRDETDGSWDSGPEAENTRIPPRKRENEPAEEWQPAELEASTNEKRMFPNANELVGPVIVVPDWIRTYRPGFDEPRAYGMFPGVAGT